MLDQHETSLREAYQARLDGAPPEVLYPDRTYHEAQLHNIERARQLVEKGPDEP
jgi:hypothetical protein